MCSSPRAVNLRPVNVTSLTWLNASDRVNGAMAAGWSTEATRALVSVWSQENVQSELDGVSRNRTIFERISNELRDKGYEKTWQQCRTKIKNLTQKYRKVRKTLQFL